MTMKESRGERPLTQTKTKMTQITLEWLNEHDTFDLPFGEICDAITSPEVFAEVFDLVWESEHEGKLNVLLADQFPEFYKKYSIDNELDG